jgi:hypothetical protein
MTRIVFTLWWISGILSLLALLFPALIVIGLFLLVLPGLMLAFAPDIFIITTVLLVAHLLFGKLPQKPQMAAYSLFLGAFVALDIAIPWSLNRSLDQYWEDLPRNDSVSDVGINRIALLFARRRADEGPPITPGCHSLCKRLLSEHAIQAVLVGSPPAADNLAPLNLQLPVTSYHIEHRPACSASHTAEPVSDAVRVVELVSDGVCLIAEPAILAASDLVIVRDRLSGGPYPQSAPWRFYADWLPAERLGVYLVRAGQSQLLMQRIRLRADLFFTPLIFGLANGYGMESVKLAVLRWPSPMTGGDGQRDAQIEEFFRRHFKLDSSFLR